MRPLVFILVSVLACFGSTSIAQPIAPRALYNPVNGGIWFDRLDSMIDADIGTLRIRSLSEGRIVKPYIIGANAVALDIQASTSTRPKSFNDYLISWQLEGLADEPINEPVFAGYIIKPGTAPTDLYLQAFAGRIGFPTSNATRIPEPTSLLAILSGGGCLIMSRWPAQ